MVFYLLSSAAVPGQWRTIVIVRSTTRTIFSWKKPKISLIELQGLWNIFMTLAPEQYDISNNVKSKWVLVLGI